MRDPSTKKMQNRDAILQGSFKLDKTSGNGRKTDQPLQKVRCCYLWDPEVIKNFANDNGIRRETAKTLLQRETNAGNISCIKALPGHGSCRHYKTWKAHHPIDASDVIRKSHTSSCSAYVPLAQVIVVHGKDVHIKGGTLINLV